MRISELLGGKRGAGEKALTKGRDRKEQEIRYQEIRYEFASHPIDVGIQFVNLCREVLGGKDFSIFPVHNEIWGDQGPTSSVVPTSPNGKESVLGTGMVKLPFGDVSLNSGHRLSMDVDKEGGREATTSFMAFCATVDERSRTRSIYRGKIIDAGWEFLGWDTPPVIFPRGKMRELEANLILPIRKKEMWRAWGWSRRTVLLLGTFGTGKTSVAKWAANEAIRNGWTFMVLNTAEFSRIVAVMRTLGNVLKPAVLFVEDIDSITTESDEEGRGIFVNAILNTIDGTEFDSSDMLFLMTSNYGERITPALKRPGRIDCIITLDLPDAETAVRTFEHYSGERCGEEVAGHLKGMSYADIKEIVGRARLLMEADGGMGVPSVGHYAEAAIQLGNAKEIMEKGSMAEKRMGYDRGR